MNDMVLNMESKLYQLKAWAQARLSNLQETGDSLEVAMIKMRKISQYLPVVIFSAAFLYGCGLHQWQNHHS
jgi:hypothetical protein